MEYQEFLCVVEKKMNQKLKGGVTASIHIALKNNGKIKRGLMIESPDVNISPTIYLEEFYERYRQGETLEEIVLGVMRFYEAVKYEKSWDMTNVKCYERVRDKIVFKLIHTKKNEEMLVDVPHIDVLDLSIVFYVLLEVQQDGTAAMLIRNEHLNIWNIEEKVLFPLACENAEKLLPACLFTMKETVGEMLELGLGVPKNLLKSSEKTLIEENPRDVMYVLTNSIRSFGAASLLYPQVLEQIGRLLKENYYILPSSVHELILVPESEGVGPKEMTAMIREVNESQVAEEEQLSDHPYYYERKKKQLMMR